jgi:hypothetical protein
MPVVFMPVAFYACCFLCLLLFMPVALFAIASVNKEVSQSSAALRNFNMELESVCLKTDSDVQIYG